MSERTVIQRHQFADYLNVGTTEEQNFVLMGTGFTTLNEEPGAQTESKKYVNEKTTSTSVTDYQTVFPFESDLIVDQAAVLALYNVGRNHLTGSDCEYQYVRVELWDAVEGKDNEYAARLFTVSVEVSDITGETDQVVSGNLNAVGDFIDGTFNTSTKTFTAASSDTSSSTTTDTSTDTETD